MNSKPYFSVVIPVYNSEKSLVELCQRLVDTFEKMGKTFELIFVNDSSRDNSLKVLKKLKDQHENIIVIDLFRNFGQQNALMCGFQYCNGKYVITIDDDLQNPPEEIIKLYNKINQGYDAVFGSFKKREDRIYKRIGSYFIRRLNRKIFNVNIPLKFSSFRILKREVVEELKNRNTSYPYISGMILKITKNLANAEVEHHKRHYGKSNYTIKKSLNLSFNLLIHYSTLPLKVINFSGLAVSFISFTIGMFFLIKKLIVGSVQSGWTSIIVLISFFASMFFLMSFVFGEYIYRILGEVAKDKQYSIRNIYK